MKKKYQFRSNLSTFIKAFIVLFIISIVIFLLGNLIFLLNKGVDKKWKK